MILDTENSIIWVKCQCMGKSVDENETLQVSIQQKMINSKEVEISGIKIDRKSSFHQHIKSISKKAGQKLNALLTISLHLEDKKTIKKQLFIIQRSNPNLVTVR